MSTHIQPSEGVKMRIALVNKIKFNELAAGQHTLAGMSLCLAQQHRAP